MTSAPAEGTLPSTTATDTDAVARARDRTRRKTFMALPQMCR
jgi:hypothetical protein